MSVKLCEKWPMPTSWAWAASVSRAVLLQGEKCPFLSCFCSETSRQWETYLQFWWVIHNPFPEVKSTSRQDSGFCASSVRRHLLGRAGVAAAN